MKEKNEHFLISIAALTRFSFASSVLHEKRNNFFKSSVVASGGCPVVGFFIIGEE